MQGGSQEPKVLVVGDTNSSGIGMNGQVFNSEGLAPTFTTNRVKETKYSLMFHRTQECDKQKQLYIWMLTTTRGSQANQSRTGILEMNERNTEIKKIGLWSLIQDKLALFMGLTASHPLS